jgi:hypothetical protein
MLCTINLRCRKTYEEIKKKKEKKIYQKEGKKEIIRGCLGVWLLLLFI